MHIHQLRHHKKSFSTNKDLHDSKFKEHTHTHTPHYTLWRTAVVKCYVSTVQTWRDSRLCFGWSIYTAGTGEVDGCAHSSISVGNLYNLYSTTSSVRTEPSHICVTAKDLTFLPRTDEISREVVEQELYPRQENTQLWTNTGVWMQCLPTHGSLADVQECKRICASV